MRAMRGTVRRVGIVALTGGALLGVVGCGSRAAEGGADVGDADQPAASAAKPSVNLVPDGYDGRFRTSATVLESRDHGPQLCYVVMESFPPQCSGPDIAGWDWSTVEAESASGTRWGQYVVIGTFDGETFTLTEPAKVDKGHGAPSGGDDLATPCPEPAGGWQPVDPETATEAAFQAATRRAHQVEGFGGLWIDQQIPDDEITEWNANDPKRFVLNVTTAGDVAAMETAIREVWGGSLCVSRVAHSAAELAEASRNLPEIPGLLSSSTDVVAGQVILDLLVAREGLQRELDESFGEGTVRLVGALEPID